VTFQGLSAIVTKNTQTRKLMKNNLKIGEKNTQKHDEFALN
jgi:hypothetical protein